MSSAWAAPAVITPGSSQPGKGSVSSEAPVARTSARDRNTATGPPSSSSAKPCRSGRPTRRCSPTGAPLARCPPDRGSGPAGQGQPVTTPRRHRRAVGESTGRPSGPTSRLGRPRRPGRRHRRRRPCPRAAPDDDDVEQAKFRLASFRAAPDALRCGVSGPSRPGVTDRERGGNIVPFRKRLKARPDGLLAVHVDQAVETGPDPTEQATSLVTPRVVRHARSPLASSAPATVMPAGAVRYRPSKRKWTTGRG